MADEPAGHSGDKRLARLGQAAARLSEPLQNYGLSLLFIGFVPLLPVTLELLVRKQVTGDSLIITAAIYSITVALASNSRLYFGFFLVASIIESTVYGSIVDGSSSPTITDSVVGIEVSGMTKAASSDVKFVPFAILIPFASVLVERLSRHVINREEFFEFLKGKAI